MLRDVLLGLLAVSSAYPVASLACALSFDRWRRRVLAAPARGDADLPPVSLLKPLRGAVPETFDTLASACRLDYPGLQIVFGVADAADPAVAVVRRLQAEFPGRDIELVVSDRRIGANAKVSNLANMLRRARHEVLVVSDADIRTEPDALRRVVPLLDEPGTGIVTCAYRAADGASLARQVEALCVNTDFAPMIAVARLVEARRYAFGALLCLRRATLEALGGFEAIADHLADDYELGRRAGARGLSCRLAPTIVETVPDLDRLPDVAAHQLRWARTCRVCRPASTFATVLTHTTLWATLFLFAQGLSATGWLGFGAAVGLRAAVAGIIAHRVLGVRATWRRLWLLPAKDLFVSAIWLSAFLGDTVRWGDATYRVSTDGRIRPVAAAHPRAVAA